MGPAGWNVQRTFKHVRQVDPTSLKLRLNRIGGFTSGGNASGGNKIRRFPGVRLLRRIQEFRCGLWRNVPKQQGVKMNRPVSRGPFQSSQTSRKVFWRSGLATAVAQDF